MSSAIILTRSLLLDHVVIGNGGASFYGSVEPTAWTVARAEVHTGLKARMAETLLGHVGAPLCGSPSCAHASLMRPWWPLSFRSAWSASTVGSVCGILLGTARCFLCSKTGT
jgi:hypothetical protein